MNDKSQVDSLRTRYFFKLFTNFWNLPISFSTQIIVSRGLGAAQFGNYSYLQDFFNQVISFFDNGSSYAFYTKLSQRPTEKGILGFYWFFVLIVTILISTLVFLVFQFNIHNLLWPDLNIYYILLALFLSFFIWYSKIINYIFDAYGLTRTGETVKMIIRFFGVLFLGFFFIKGMISLPLVFVINIIIYAFLCASWYLLMKIKTKKNILPLSTVGIREVKDYTAEFYHYSAPLFTYSLVGVLVGLFERWMLQTFAGSTQQGFFGLSAQLGSFCFIFTSAFTPLIMREFSIEFVNKNIDNMRNIFLKNIPLLYYITSSLSSFIAFNASDVATYIGGSAFLGASGTLLVYSFYPIHQTYGQLSGALFYASGKTKLYRNIGVFSMVLGLGLTFFLIAPRSKYGLNMGSLGLAIKMLVMQFVNVNIQLWFNAKYLKISFLKLIFHQLIVVLVTSFLAVSVREILFGLVGNNLVVLIASGFIYCVLNFLTVFFFPTLIYTRKEVLLENIINIKNKFNKIFFNI